MLLLRKMKSEDCVQIAELECEIFPDAWTKEGIEETFHQSHAFIVVAEEEQKIQGYAIIYQVLDEAEIARIAVQSEGRRQGTGAKLLAFCETVCKEKGGKRLLLDVRESNVPARSFYEKHGFCVDGIRKRFYERPQEDAILMSKSLESGDYYH